MQYIKSVNNARLELREADTGTVTLVGYASVFDQPTVLSESGNSVYTEVIRPGAFKNTLADGHEIKALTDHDTANVIGSRNAGTLRLSEDDYGLRVEIDLPNTTLARDLAENIRIGNLTSMSFAFSPRPNGQILSNRLEGGKNISLAEITDCDLFEVSCVCFPAYSQASVSMMNRSKDLKKLVKDSVMSDINFKYSYIKLLAIKGKI